MPIRVLTEGEAPIIADVVFVHGLHGDFIKTWSKGEFLWPKLLLQKDLSNVRTITWGYDSNVAHFFAHSSRNSLFGHADNLLLDIATFRTTPQEKRRPIIFVGHSLGGLVIKAALVKAGQYFHTEQDGSLGSIYNCLAGVIFLGTPHRGSHLAAWAEILKKVARITLRQPNDHLLRTLTPESDTLQSQRDAFTSFTEKVTVACFYEEQPTAAGMVVEESSACYDGFRVKKSSIPSDHMNMCKFETADEDGYRRILHYLREFLDTIPSDATSGPLANLLPQPTSRGSNDRTRFPIYLRPPRLSHFIGRTQELAGIHKILELEVFQRPEQIMRCTLHGLGGVGKSEIAVEYTYRNANCFALICWFGKGSLIDYTKTYCGLGKRLGVLGPNDECDASSVDKTRASLESMSESWLLVFDDVAALQDISSLLPSTLAGNSCVGQHCTIFTTQLSGLEQDERSKITVHTLGHSPALEMLSQYLGPSDLARLPEDSVHQIIHSVGGLPLFIATIGSIIRESMCDLSDVMDALQVSDLQWMDQATNISLRYGRSPKTVFDSALDGLTSQSASNLICLLTLLDGDYIPDTLLFAPHEEPSLQYLASTRVSGFTYKRLGHELQAHSLVRRARNGFHVHRAVQEVLIHKLVYDAIPGQTAKNIFMQILQILERGCCPVSLVESTNVETLSDYRERLPHIVSLCARGRRFNFARRVELAGLAINTGVVMWQYGCIRDGMTLLGMAEEIMNDLECYDTPLRADMETVIGLLNRELGVEGTSISRDRFRKAIMIRELDGKEHTNLLLLAKSHLASAILQDGEVQPAKQLYTECLSTLHTLGQNLHAEYVAAVLHHGLAFCSLASTCVPEAVELAEQVLRDLKSASIEKILSQRLIFGVACVLFKTGYPERAYKMHNEILEFRMRSYPATSILPMQSLFACAVQLLRRSLVSDTLIAMAQDCLERATAGSWNAAIVNALYLLARIHSLPRHEESTERAQLCLENARKRLDPIVSQRHRRAHPNESNLIEFIQPVFEGRLCVD